MSFLTALPTEARFFQLPQGPDGWVAWSFLLGLVLYLGLRWRRFNVVNQPRRLALLAVLTLLVPVSSLYAGVRLPSGPALPYPGLPMEPEGPALMVFAALPWTLAAGLLGPAPAAALAALSGGLIGLLDTHSPFTPLEYALLGTLLSAGLRQRYRTWFYRQLSRPPLAALSLSFLYPLVFALDAFFLAVGSLPVRLDFALSRVGMASLAVAGELFAAGLVAGLVAYAWPAAWGGRGPLQPSPVEKSLEARFQYTLGALILGMVILLTVGDWVIAGRAARQLLQQRMVDTAQMGAESIPFFLETGQNLISQFAADPRLYSAPAPQLPGVLEGQLRSAPYFRQLFVLDAEGQPVAGYPVRDFSSLFPTPEERVGVDLARQGVEFQYYTVPPVEGEGAAQVSFIAAILDEAGELRGVLLGRTDLASNPFTRPLVSNLERITELGGEGMLIDDQGRILYHPHSNLVMSLYDGQLGDLAAFYDEVGPDGTRQLVYYRPVVGRSWALVLTASAQQAQQLALNIAAPLLGLLSLLSLCVLALMRVGLRVVTSSLQSLAVQAERIAQGQLEHRLEVTGADEVGQLRRAFEEMRVRLLARLNELNRLLLVSQGVAASLEVESAVQPILDSALSVGVSSARIVLAPQALPDAVEGKPTRFGSGPSTEQFCYLDEQILALTAHQPQVVLANPSRARVLSFEKGNRIPEAILCVALRHETMYYGTLWVAHDQPRPFSDEEKRFLATLAGQAALAAANARLYLSAEIGRQRLEAILASTPDPVLVTDHQNRLLLANPAALQALSDAGATGEGLPISQVITQPEVLDLLESSGDEFRSVEIALPDGRYFYATASSVVADGKRMGRVCVMQDITRFKELDAMKSEFVETVTHDLRSPLTLMRGYATMLQMVGELNEHQMGYVRKILTSVEHMTRLVVNLLDLGRIEAGVGLKLEKLHVQEVVEQVTSQLQSHAAQKRISLEVEIPPHAPPLIEADQALLEQALQNLLDNAIKYTEPGGQVKVRVSERLENLIFEISDTGIGIAPIDQPRLFEKFYRGARREARAQRGSGLGLAIVQSIAKRHGGRVWVESQLGKGSRFYLEIPIRQPGRRGG